MLPDVLKVGAVLAVAGAAVALARARRRGRGAGAVGAGSAPAVLALAAFGAVWTVLIAVLTEHGYSGNPRYLMPAIALACVLGGLGWAWLAGLGDRLLGRLGAGRRMAGAVRAAAVLAVVGVLVPFLAPRVKNQHRLASQLRYQARITDDLHAAVDRVGGAGVVRACGQASTGNYEVPALAWRLDVHIHAVAVNAITPGPGLPGEVDARGPGDAAHPAQPPALPPGRAHRGVAGLRGGLHRENRAAGTGRLTTLRRMALAPARTRTLGLARDARAELGRRRRGARDPAAGVAVPAHARRPRRSSGWTRASRSGSPRILCSTSPALLRQDGSPPLYYMVLHLWMGVFGDSETRTHALSVACRAARRPGGAVGRLEPVGAARRLDRAPSWRRSTRSSPPTAQETRMYCAALAAGARRHRHLPARVRLSPARLPARRSSILLALMVYTHNWGLFFGVGAVASRWLVLVRDRDRAARACCATACSASARAGAALRCPGCPRSPSRPRTPARRGATSRASASPSRSPRRCSAAPGRPSRCCSAAAWGCAVLGRPRGSPRAPRRRWPWWRWRS